MPERARTSDLCRLLVLMALGPVLVTGPGMAQETGQKTPATATYYLLRHAEKADDGTADPPLSPQGQERARALVERLLDAAVTHLYSTPYRRTLDTLAPLAKTTGLSVEIYDPRDLPALAARLLETPGVHVVVGHSNTTPELAGLLGGDPGPVMDESEYGRLYVLERGADGSITSEIRHLPIEPPPSESLVSSPAPPER